MSSNLIVNNIEVGAGATIYTAASNQLAFGTNGSEKVRIASNGNVRIGSAGAPNIAVGGGLEIERAGAATIRIEDSSSTSGFEIQNTGGVIKQRLYNNQPWTIEYGGGEKLRITSTGKVGIGTNNPAHLLHLEGASPVIQFEDTDNAANIYSLINAGGSAGRLLFQVDPANAGTNSYVAFDIDGGEKLRIHSGGQVSIGTATEGHADADELTISTTGRTGMTIRSGSSEYGNIFFSDATSGSGEHQGIFQYYHQDDAFIWKSGASATERLCIDSSGKVGVGKTDPDGQLDVLTSRTTAYNTTGDQRGLAHIIARNASDAADRFASISLVSGGGTQAEGSINLVQTGNYTGDLTFKSRTGATSWTEKLRITSDGTVSTTGAVGINTTNLEGNMVYLNHNGTNSPTTAVTIGGRGIVARGGTGIFLKSSSNTSDNRYGTRIHSIREESNNGASSLVISNEKSDASALAEVLRITSAARIGIGITNPVRMLHLHESHGNEAMIHFSTSATGVAVGDGFRVGMNGSEEAIVWNNENGIIKFGTSNGERARITGIGSFGIHEDNPITKVHIGVVGKETITYGGGQHDTGCVRIEDKGSNNGYYHGLEFRTKRSGDVRLYAHDAGSDAAHFVIATDNSGIHERFRITNEGKVGINTTNPNALLEFGVARSLQSYPPIKFKGRWGNGLADAAISTTDDTGGVDLMIGANLYMGSSGTLTRYYDTYGSAAVRVGYNGITRFYNKSGNNAPVESMRINGSGQVGINTATWWDNSVPLTVYNGTSGSEHTIIDIMADTNETSRISFSEVGDTNKGSIRYAHGSLGDYMSVWTNGAERLRIDDSGRVKLGTISDHTSTTTHCPVYIRMTTDITAVNTAEGGANTGLVRLEETGSNANRYHGIELRNKQSGDIRFLNQDVDTSDRGDFVLVMPSGGAPSLQGCHYKMRFESRGDSIQIAGKGGATLLGTSDSGYNKQKVDLYISTKTGVTAVDTQAGDEVAGLIRFEDIGSSNNRYHGLELRNRNSGDARILNKSVGADNTAQMWFAVDGKNKSTDSNGIREALVINNDMVVSGKMILNREMAGGQGHNCWTTSGDWKNLVDLQYYPNNCLYICDAAMQYSTAYIATFWVYKTRQSQYKIVHDQDSLCHFRVTSSILQIQQNSGVDQTDTFGYQKVFMAPMGMDYNETALS